jgi:hypothetical protein
MMGFLPLAYVLKQTNKCTSKLIRHCCVIKYKQICDQSTKHLYSKRIKAVSLCRNQLTFVRPNYKNTKKVYFTLSFYEIYIQMLQYNLLFTAHYHFYLFIYSGITFFRHSKFYNLRIFSACEGRDLKLKHSCLIYLYYILVIRLRVG